MAVLEVYTRCLKTKYKSRYCSHSTLIVILLGVFSIMIPFFLAYKSKGFWLKHDTFYEQPDVRFRGDYLFIATTNNLSQPISCGSYGYYQRYIKNFDKCSIIRVREVDEDFDGKVDQFKMTMDIFLTGTVKITMFTLIIPIEYKIQDFCPFEIQSAIIHQSSLREDVVEYSLFADLMISQSSPLVCDGGNKVPNYNNTSVIAKEKQIDSFKIENILANYLKQKMTTHLTNVYTNILHGEGREFHVHLDIRYPEHKLYYTPGFWQIIKQAWIQYYAIYIVVAWILWHIKNYIFVHRWVLFYEDCPIKKND